MSVAVEKEIELRSRRSRLIIGAKVILNERQGDGLKPTRHVQHRKHVDFGDHAPILNGQINAAEGQTQRPRRRDGQLGEFGREAVDGNGGGHGAPGLSIAPSVNDAVP